MEGVELQDLRVFLVLAEELHFGRTALRLHLSPARVSQVIAALERRLGSPLLIRTSRKVELTEFGTTLRDDITPWVRGLQSSLESARLAASADGGTLTIGFWGLSASERIGELITAFEKRHPTCTVQLVEVVLTDPLQALRRGEIDLMTAWVPFDEPGITIGRTLFTAGRVVAVSRNHPLAARAQVSWEDVADYRVSDPVGTPASMKTLITPSRTPSGRPIRTSIAVRTLPEIFAAVARGLVVHPSLSVTSNFYGHPDIVWLPIVDAAPVDAAIVHRTDGLSPLARLFLDEVGDGDRQG